MDLSGITRWGKPRTDREKFGGRWNPDSGGKSKVAAGDVEENIAEREVYRRCPDAENLYSGFPFQEAGQE